MPQNSFHKVLLCLESAYSVNHMRAKLWAGSWDEGASED